MEKRDSRSARSDLSNGDDGDCAFYSRLRNRQNVYSDVRVLHVASSKEDPEKPMEKLVKKKDYKNESTSGNKRRFVRPPTPMPKPLQRGIRDRGDFLEDDEDTDSSTDSGPNRNEFNSPDESIKIHSLSSKATIVVPETNQSNHQVLDSVMQYENNYIRPQSARIPGSILKNNRKSPSNENSDSEDSNTPRKNVSFASPGSRLSTASSTKTVIHNRNAHSSKTKKLDQQIIFEEDEDSPYFPTESRPDTVQSVHAPVHPRKRTRDTSKSSRNNTGYYSPLSTGVSWLAAESPRPPTASTEVVHRGFITIDDEKIETARKILQASDDSYNEWREGMPDPEEDSKAVKDLVQKLYEVEVKEMATEQRTKYYVYKLLLGHMVELLDDFAFLPCPPGYVIRCRVTRSRIGLEGALFPQYFLHLQRVGEPDVLLMTARKSKSIFGSKYIICTDPADVSTRSKHCLGVLESNIKSSDFTLYPEQGFDNLAVSGPSGNTMWSGRKNQKRQELLRMSFESNPLGFRGPRKLKVDIPKMKSDYERIAVDGSFKDAPNSLLRLKNKDPVWNQETHSFILNFHNRVMMSSVKNFILIHPEMIDVDLFQFGRLDKNSFILDFRYPFCPLQAFSIGLSSFDVKWGLE